MPQPATTIARARPQSPRPVAAVRMPPVRRVRGLNSASVAACICVAGLLAQEAAWANVHYMQRIAMESPDVLYRALILLIPFVAGALVAISRHRHVPLPKGWGLMLVGFLSTTGISFVTATESCYQFRYFAGDFLRFSAPWLTLFLSYWAFATIRREHGLDALLVWYDRLALVALLDAAITAGFGLAFFGCHISNWFFIFLVGWAILNNRYSELTTNLVLMAVLFTTAMSAKRTNFVLLAAAIVAAMVVKILRGGSVFRVAFSLLGMMLVGLGAQVLVQSYTGGQSIVAIGDKIMRDVNEIVVNGNTDNSYQIRLNEVENIRSYFTTHPADMVFGIGFGGEIPQVYDSGFPTDSGNMHHAHKGWWLYLLRNGFLGVALLAVFTWMCTWGLYSAPSPAPLATAACAIYGGTRIVAAFTGNLMMEDLDLPLVIGLGFALVGHRPNVAPPHFALKK
jgi:hypothetical protein